MAAALRIRQSGNLLPIKSLKTKHFGVVRNLRTLKVMHGGALRLVANFVAPLSAAIIPPEAQGIGNSLSPIAITTNSVTCVPTGGVGPYGYAWSYVSGDSFIVPVPGNAATAFSRSSVPQGAFYSAVYRCVITDSTGQTAQAQVAVFVRNEGP